MSTTTDITATHDATDEHTGAASRPNARSRFRAWRRARPFWGGLLVVASGLEMFFSGQLDFGHIHVQVGVQGMQAMILPLVLVLLGVLTWSMPVHRVFYGVIALILSIYSLVGVNLGGFFIGMILGIVGSVMAVSWLPRDDGKPVDPVDTDARDTQELGVDEVFAMRGATIDRPDATDRIDPVDPTASGEPSAPRPFLTASAETGATETGATNGRHGRRRSSALGIGLLVTALSTGAVTSATAFTGATAPTSAGFGNVSASTNPLCVLDPLHLVCAAPTSADPAPAATPTATTTTAAVPTTNPTSAPSATSGPATTQPTQAANDDNPDGATEDPAATADGSQSDAPAGSATTPATVPGKTPSSSPSSAAGPSASPSSNPYAPAKTAGPMLRSTSDQPVVPAYTAQLSGTAFDITDSWYVGNVTLKRADGSTVTAMKFTAKKAVVPGFQLKVPTAAGSTHGLLATADSITFTGDVVLYATKFSGSLLGIPLSFSPTSPPPSIIPLPSLKDVQIAMVANSGDSLSYDNPHQRLY